MHCRGRNEQAPAARGRLQRAVPLRDEQDRRSSASQAESLSDAKADDKQRVGAAIGVSAGPALFGFDMHVKEKKGARITKRRELKSPAKMLCSSAFRLHLPPPAQAEPAHAETVAPSACVYTGTDNSRVALCACTCAVVGIQSEGPLMEADHSLPQQR